MALLIKFNRTCLSYSANFTLTILILFFASLNWTLMTIDAKSIDKKPTNPKPIKPDKSKIKELTCNDHLDRFVLNISSKEIASRYTSASAKLFIKYKYSPCDNLTSNCQYQTLLQTKLSSSDTKSSDSFRFIVNSYFTYNFQVVLVASSNLNNEFAKNEFVSKNDSYNAESINETTELCQNVTKVELRFTECDQYELDLTECSLRLVKPTPNSKHYIKYIYIFVVSVLVIFILFKAIQMIFFRYKLLNN